MVNRPLTPAEIRRDTISHLRWQAKAVANLLSAVHRLPADDQQTTLCTTARLADELAGELAGLLANASTPHLVAAASEPGIELSAEELRLLMAYRGMQDFQRHVCLKLTEGWACNQPRREKPKMRLVAGGVV